MYPKIPFLRTCFVVSCILACVLGALSFVLFQNKDQDKEKLKEIVALATSSNSSKPVYALQSKKAICKSLIDSSGTMTVCADLANLTFARENGGKKSWKEDLQGVHLFLKEMQGKAKKGTVTFSSDLKATLEEEVVFSSEDSLGFVIQGRRAIIEDNKILFEEPLGALQGDDPFYFKGDTLVFEPQEKTLILKRNATVSLGGVKELQTENGITVVLADEDSKKCRYIRSFGPFKFSFYDIPKEQVSYLQGHGALEYDHLHRILKIDRGDAPIHFISPRGDVKADHLEMVLGVDEKLFLKGNVKLIQRSSLDGLTLRYALCDTLKGDQALKIIDLEASSPKKVLLFDVANNCEMSAKAFSLFFDTPKGKVEGKGDVQLRFSKQEFQKMQEAFKSVRK